MRRPEGRLSTQLSTRAYEIGFSYDNDWNMLPSQSRMLKGYGDNKYNSVVSNGKTKKLKLNVQPLKIGFEDLFTVIAVYDLFAGACECILGKNTIPVNFIWKDIFSVNNNELSLSRLLAEYYGRIPEGRKYPNLFQTTIEDLRNTYGSIFPSSCSYDLAMNNLCSKCKRFGFLKPHNVSKCSFCSHEINESESDV